MLADASVSTVRYCEVIQTESFVSFGFSPVVEVDTDAIIYWRPITVPVYSHLYTIDVRYKQVSSKIHTTKKKNSSPDIRFFDEVLIRSELLYIFLLTCYANQILNLGHMVKFPIMSNKNC